MLIVVGITGASGSGKSKLATMLKEHFGDEAIIFSGDRYYKSSSEIPNNVNMDDPVAWDHERLLLDLKKLKSGLTIDAPVCRFDQPLETRETEKITPTSIIIVDGVILFRERALREFFDIKIFVHASTGICLNRRMQRDKEERSISYDENIKRYPQIFQAYMEHTKPSKQIVDLHVDNKNFKNTMNVQHVIDWIDSQKQSTLLIRAKL